MNPHVTTERHRSEYPVQSWYVAATSDEVTSAPLGRRALDTALVIFRTSGGAPVVLEDRDAHRPYPLSLGHTADDLIVCSYSGFAYAADGHCVSVPTQAEVPYGARVRAFPVREQDGLVWVWFGEAGLADLRRPPSVPWLADGSWATLGAEWTTAADFLLLHENFADITHVAVVDPIIAPPALTVGPVPLLEVEVSETSVSFHRDFPPAPLAPWHAPLVGAAPEAQFVQHEDGRFVSPGLWVNSWDVVTEAVPASTFRFTHAVTPLDRASTRHIWRVSRNFALGDEVSANLLPIFTDYYERVRRILETMQQVITIDGARDDVSVAADAAVLQVRKIIGRMVAEQRPK
jgi:phenylpropionate dioxygenase-like ring-hydroxylating dioxygenase large terminal subunit